jgi:hypothetical protein
LRKKAEVKRGWITWDQAELPPSAFQARLDRVKKIISERNLPGLVVYTDVWKSNQARYLVNFMPYWNRSLLVIPQDRPPILICALSPRVYPWIRSISILEEIRAGGDPARVLLQLCSENKWNRIGFLDLMQLPHGIYTSIRGGPVEIVDLPAHEVLPTSTDEWELSMRRHAAKMARDIVSEELPGAVGVSDYQFVGRLERKFRRAGAEDLVILVTNGSAPPAPARGATLTDGFSLAVAVEYRGHWARLARPHSSASAAESMRSQFERIARDLETPRDTPICVENLSGPYPYEAQNRSEVSRGSVFALDVEFRANGNRLFYGDTCWYGETGAELL